MNSRHAIATLDELRAVSHPLRIEILKQLIERPMTTSEVAEALGEKPSKLYYHVAELEKFELIQVVETRQKGNLTEKLYRPRADDFVVDPALFQREGPEGAEVLCQSVSALLDAALLDLRRLARRGFLAGARLDQVQRTHVAVRQSPAKIAELRRRLRDLLEEFNSQHDPEGAAEVALSLVLYPRPTPADPAPEPEPGATSASSVRTEPP